MILCAIYRCQREPISAGVRPPEQCLFRLVRSGKETWESLIQAGRCLAGKPIAAHKTVQPKEPE